MLASGWSAPERSHTNSAPLISPETAVSPPGVMDASEKVIVAVPFAIFATVPVHVFSLLVTDTVPFSDRLSSSGSWTMPGPEMTTPSTATTTLTCIDAVMSSFSSILAMIATGPPTLTPVTTPLRIARCIRSDRSRLMRKAI